MIHGRGRPWRRRDNCRPTSGFPLIADLHAATAPSLGRARSHPRAGAARPRRAQPTPIEPRRADSLVADAATALERGRPWQASRLIAVVLLGFRRAGRPTRVMLAATAASRWGGWPEVTRLLDGQRWVDSAYDGRGPAAPGPRRAGAGGGFGRAAPRPGRAAPRSAAAEGERLVLLATALDRLHARDSAAASYVRAAEPAAVHRRVAPDPRRGGHRRQRPRARAVRRGSTTRSRATGSAGARPPAHTRHGRPRTARPPATPRSAPAPRRSAFGWRRAPTARAGPAVRRDLTALVAARRSPGEVAGRDRAARQRVCPAHAGRGARGRPRGAPRRAVTPGPSQAFEAALRRRARQSRRTASPTPPRSPGSAATPTPRRQFALVLGPRELAASAAYQRARALVRAGEEVRGKLALAAVLLRYPRDTTAASSALFLLGDLASDDRADARARALVPAGRDPLSQQPLRPDRRLPRRDDRPARRVTRPSPPRSSTSSPAAIPGATRRARPSTGPAAPGTRTADNAAARERWEPLADGDPGSYYTGLAAAAPRSASLGRRRPRRLVRRRSRAPTARWRARPCSPGWVSWPRAAGSTIGWCGRATARRSGCSRLPHAFRREGVAAQSIQLARRALALGAPARRAHLSPAAIPSCWRTPCWPRREEHGLDAGFVAALIRQESMFNPTATSAGRGAGADAGDARSRPAAWRSRWHTPSGTPFCSISRT